MEQCHTNADAAPVPARALAMICRAAVAKGLARGRREAILERMEEMAADLFAGPSFFAALFGDCAENPAFADHRDIGDLFLREAFSGQEERRASGSFYTPSAVVDDILDRVWGDLFPGGEIGRDATLCDPAMGCGYFLIRAVERLIARRPGEGKGVRTWARACLFGVDRDPAAVFLTRAFLWLLLSEPGREFLPPPEHLRCADSLLGPPFAAEADASPDGGDGALDWGAAFPRVAAAGGFAAIVGNPPYEVLTNFAKHPERRLQADAIRASGLYRDALAGQINLYRCFIERSLDLLRPGGVLSMIVPLSLTRDASAVGLRRRLLERERAESWLLFGEKERVFSGVTQSACIFKATKDGGAADALAVTSQGAATTVPLADVFAFGGGDPVIPLLAPAEAELWKWLLRNCPGRLPDLAEMRVGEVDQTFFRDCMRDDDTGCLLARGAHLAPFALDVEPVPGKERFLDLPLFLSKRGTSAELCRRRAGVWRVVQLGIRNMYTRPRLVAALAPPGVYLGNSLNVYWPREGVSIGFLAGMLNSRFADWLFCLGSGNNNINLLEMRRLPFPGAPTAEEAAAVAAAYDRCAAAAGDAAGLALARDELDAAVLRCYRVPEELAGAVPRWD